MSTESAFDIQNTTPDVFLGLCFAQYNKNNFCGYAEFSEDLRIITHIKRAIIKIQLAHNDGVNVQNSAISSVVNQIKILSNVFGKDFANDMLHYSIAEPYHYLLEVLYGISTKTVVINPMSDWVNNIRGNP
jgi:hypothetical protein